MQLLAMSEERILPPSLLSLVSRCLVNSPAPPPCPSDPLPSLSLSTEGVHPGFRSLVFSMRHTAQCRVDQYDSQGIALLGFLPQDVVGRSMVDLFHPEDLPAIKDIYKKGADVGEGRAGVTGVGDWMITGASLVV